jgi:uncharacterized membrane protein YeiH
MCREILTGATPVSALADQQYPSTAMGDGLAVFLVPPQIARLRKPVMVCDAPDVCFQQVVHSGG